MGNIQIIQGGVIIVNKMDIFGEQENYLSTTPTVTDNLERMRRGRTDIFRDSTLKSLLSNARFTGFLLEQIIPELKGMTLDEFCEAVGADAVTGNSIEGLKTEYGAGGLKDIRLDIVFDVDYNGNQSIQLRIDVEPQSTQQTFRQGNESSYSLVQRGIYYGALTMATLLKSAESYHKIHKVYSIWLCYASPIACCKEPIIRYKMQHVKDYKYTDGSSIYKEKHKFDAGDLLEVVFISVNDLCEDDEIQFNLKQLLDKDIPCEERLSFYKENEIVNKEGGIGMGIISYEELKQQLEEAKEDLIYEVRDEIKEEVEKKLLTKQIVNIYRKQKSDPTLIAIAIANFLCCDEDFVKEVIEKL